MPGAKDLSTAVVGVGAIGSLLAESLMAAAQRPLLCVRAEFDALVVKSPEGERRWTAFDGAVSPSGKSPVDLLVVATKAHQAASAEAWFRALVGPRTLVLVVQNGVEHGALMAPFVPDGATVVPGIIDVPAKRLRPGEVEVSRSGSLRVPDDEAARRVVDILAETPVLTSIEARADFDAIMWRKLAVNVISGAIPALTDRSAGVFRDPEIEALARHLVEECVAVARAAGTALPEATVDEIIAGFQSADPNALGSMLQDRRAGKPLETDARNGAVARFGRRFGIPTPYNEAVAALAGAVNR